TTIAGIPGGQGYSGDNGPATSARLNYPEGIAYDSLGNLYIADALNDRVRRVDVTTHIVTTVAGNGNRGFTGDGVATAVKLFSPAAVIIDPSDNVIVADQFNNRVRLIDLSTGMISTIAGNGNSGSGGDGGLATDAELNLPTGMAYDSAGNLL